MGFNNPGPHAATWELTGEGLGSSGGEGFVILPGLSVDSKERGRKSEGRWEAQGAHSRRDTQETRQDVTGLRGKENLEYREGCLLGMYEVLGSIPTTTTITTKDGNMVTYCHHLQGREAHLEGLSHSTLGLVERSWPSRNGSGRQ